MKILKDFILSIIIVVCLNVTHSVNAEIQTYEGIGEYLMSDFETMEVAQERARVYAEMNAKEKAGIYVRSYSKSNNAILEEDEIETIAATIIKVLDVQYETILTDKGIVHRAKVKVNIDSDEIPRWLARDTEERKKLIAQNNELKRQFEEQNKNIAELKKKIFGDNNKNSDSIKRDFEKAEAEFLSNQRIMDGNPFYDKNEYEQAINSYNEAIKLDPNNSLAYIKRGTAYFEMENYSACISDFTKALAFYPNDYNIYEKRALSYASIGDVDNARKDLMKMIEIDPNDTRAHMYLLFIDYQLFEQE